MNISDEALTITMGKAGALVLFDLLFGFRDEPQLVIRNDAQRVTLWMLEACLEKLLAEPFSGEFGRILEQAREKVLMRWGVPGQAPDA